MRLSVPTCLCFALALAWLAPEAQAETPESSDLGQVLVEDSQDALNTDKPSGFVSVIHPDKYSDQLTTLPELLSQQVGVHVNSFGGIGQLSTVSIRGSTAEQVSVFLDGVKINTAQGGAVDFSTIPLGSIDRVEVLRGGASSQFGSDAIGGVINIVTKRAKRKRSIELRYSEGSFFTIQTHEGFSQKFKSLGLTLDHTHLSSDGDFTFKNTGIQFAGGGSVGGGQTFTRLHNGFVSEGFLTRVDADLSENQRLSATNDFYFTSRDLPGAELETTQLFPLNPLDGHEDLFRNAFGLQWNWDHLWVRDLGFSLLPNYRVERSHFTDATPALGGPINVTYLNQSAGIKPKWTYFKDFKGHSHAFTWLYDFRYDRFSDSSPIPGTPLSGTHQRVTNALFFQDEIGLIGEKLLLNPSVRFENANDFGNDVAMHFGIVGKPARWVSLKSNVENSFRYPSFNELFFPNQGFIRGNPDLLKEEAINFDIGANFHHAWMEVELSYFRNAIDNSIVFVPISAFTIAPVNTGPVTSQGLEASVSLRPFRFWEVTGNYTFLDARLDGSGNLLPGRPRQMANARMEFSWKYGSVFGEMQYQGKLPLDFINSKFVSPATMFNLGGTFKWKNHYFVTLQGLNVGNVQTFDSVGFPLPRAQVYFSFGYKT
jgi:Outer membrane cobalamin receptor protein